MKPARTLLLALALLLALPAADAAAKCRKGQVEWKLEGRKRCVKSRSLARPAARPEAVALTERALTALSSAPAKTMESPLTAGQRRALGRKVKTIAGLAERVRTQAMSAATAARLGMQAAPGPSSASVGFGGGDLKGTLSGTFTPATGVKLGVKVEIKSGRDTAQVGIDVDLGKLGTAGADSCPDLNGRVVIRDRTSFTTTTVNKRGGRVVSEQTTKVTTETETVGITGEDGFLTHVSTTETETQDSSEPGTRVERTTRATIGGAPDATGTLEGTPSVDVRVRASGMSRSQEQAAERDIAQSTPGAKQPSASLAEAAKRGRERMVELSRRWNGTGPVNSCVSVVWDPETPGQLNVGESSSVNGKLKRADGAFAPATWTVGEVAIGTFTGGGRAPAAGQTFNATGGGPRFEETVRAEVLAASRSGRVTRTWLAKLKELPQEITAVLHQTEVVPFSGGEQRFEFRATARWTRTSFTSHSDGSRVAEYEIASGAVTEGRWSVAALCSYAGDVRGGTATSGTFDLIMMPDGTARYGFHVNVNAGRLTFPKTGGAAACPSSTDPGIITALAQGRRGPDSSLYDAPVGALNGNVFDVTRTGVTGSLGDVPSVRAVTMDWTLSGR